MVANAPTDIQYKSVSTYGVQTVDEEQGIVEAFVSGIGNKDSVADIIEPGAFENSLKARKPKGVWSHDWNRPVSKTLEIYEVPAGDSRLPEKMKAAGIGGLYVKTQFNLETQDGRDALSWVKFFGEESEWSIGYKTVKQKYDNEVKAMRLKELDLYEYSPVIFGANPLTSTVGVKVMVPSANGESKAIEVKIQGVNQEMSGKLTQVVQEAILKAIDDGEDEIDLDEIVQKAGADLEDESEDTSEEVEEVENKDAEDSSESEKAEESEEESSDDDEPAASDDGDVDDEPEEVEDPEEDEQQIEDSDEEDEEAPVEKSANSVVVNTAKALVGSVELTRDEAQELISEIAVKYIPGSFEERRCTVSDALREQYQNGYPYIRAMFDSSVVFEVEDWNEADGYSCECFEASYSLDGQGGVVISDIKPVEIVEVVMAKSALVDAIFKGHGSNVRNLLSPLVDVSSADEGDAEVKAAVQKKAGASISSANMAVIQAAFEAVETALENLETLMGVETEEEDAAEGEMSGDKSAKANDEAEEDADTWTVEQREEKWVVVKSGSDEVVESYDTEEEAATKVAELSESVEEKALVDEGNEDEEESEPTTIDADAFAEFKSLLDSFES